MSDLPKHVEIHEEGPREGFQIEPGPIGTTDKIKLIEALAETGLYHMQVASFVSPRIVPGWADAEVVVAGFTPKEGVHYTALCKMTGGLDAHGKLIGWHIRISGQWSTGRCSGSVYLTIPRR
jgi:isopropylmalate/homocitrate/citramalate synthase